MSHANIPVCVHITCEMVAVCMCVRCAQIPHARLPRQLNFVWWHLIFVGPDCETYCMYLFGTWNFDVAATFFKYLWTPDVCHCVLVNHEILDAM